MEAPLIPANPLWDPALEAPPPPEGATCGGCAFRARATGRCARHAPRRAPAAWPACPAFVAALDCQACGACCGPAYDCVEVGPDEPFARDHAALLVRAFGQLQLPRPGGRCPCLEGQAPQLTCRLYAERPQSCRDFPVGGRSCVEARRRVGLSP
ncbi:YkgJ family cysteine cluster protein [Myxococcota bacterium]|nr:YkgJ family cysteine cluster protein [Myxococcota bacterium]